MKRNLWTLALAAAAAAVTLAAPAFAAFQLKGEPKIAMILFAQRNDGGWTQALDEARARLEKKLGVQIPSVDNVPENAAQIRPAAELFISKGFNVIIGSAFGYSDTFKELAAAHPDVAFINPSGTTNGPNLQSVYGRTYESQYLCGMAAGAVSKTGKLGFVAANPFGVVIWTVNAFQMGAKLTNPNATTTVIFTGAWNDPVKERAAAEALIEQGVDVIGQHVDTPAVQLVAQEKGIHATAHHRDMSEFAPKATLCSSIWLWDQFIGPELEKIAAGKWEPSPYGAFVHIGGGIDVACCSDVVPADAKAKIMAERDAIIAGKHIYAGPISDTTGKERVPAGKELGDGDLWAMDWFIPGVISQK